MFCFVDVLYKWNEQAQGERTIKGTALWNLIMLAWCVDFTSQHYSLFDVRWMSLWLQSYGRGEHIQTNESQCFNLLSLFSQHSTTPFIVTKRCSVPQTVFKALKFRTVWTPPACLHRHMWAFPRSTCPLPTDKLKQKKGIWSSLKIDVASTLTHTILDFLYSK